MRDAFVLTLDDTSDPRRRRFAGWVEDVETGREHRFRSTGELLAFLADCLDRRHRARARDRQEED